MAKASGVAAVNNILGRLTGHPATVDALFMVFSVLGAEGVLDGPSSLAHGARRQVHPSQQSVDGGFVFPAGHPSCRLSSINARSGASGLKTGRRGAPVRSVNKLD